MLSPAWLVLAASSPDKCEMRFDEWPVRYRTDVHPLRRDVSGRESGDGRSDVDDLPAVVGRRMAFSTSATTWTACGRRGRRRPLAERPRNHWRYAELLPLEAERGSARLVGRIDADHRFAAAGSAVGRPANPAQGRRPQSDGVVQGPGQLGRRCSCAAGRREDDRLCLDRQRGEQPGRSRGAGRAAGVYFCAANGAGAEGRPAASVRRDGVRGEVVVRCGVRSVLEGVPRVRLVQSQLRDQSGAGRRQENGRAGSCRAVAAIWAACPIGWR